jgi:hypothetical protein
MSGEEHARTGGASADCLHDRGSEESGVFSELFVCSDDPATYQIALQAGARFGGRDMTCQTISQT